MTITWPLGTEDATVMGQTHGAPVLQIGGVVALSGRVCDCSNMPKRRHGGGRHVLLYRVSEGNDDA
jgi:hypothetical protein